MAWTDPAGHVWVTGEVVTAANMNTYVRLNLEALRNAPACRVFNSSAISVATGALVLLTFNSERFDNDGIHSTTTNTGRLTCVTAGAYLITGAFSFAASAAGSQRSGLVRLNGVTQIGNLDAQRNGASATSLTISTIYKLAVGDYVELGVFQDTGGSLNVNASGNFSPEFAMAWLSAGA